MIMEETPTKVMSLLGASLVSMAFLFSIVLTNAGFEGTQARVVDPFGPTHVVAVIDNVSHSYSVALHNYVIDSGAKDFAIAADNLAWIGSNAKDGALAMLGVHSGDGSQLLVTTQVAQASTQGRVAGAYTNTPYQEHQSFVDSVLSALGLE